MIRGAVPLGRERETPAGGGIPREKGNMTDERIDPIGSVTPEPTCTEYRRRPRWAESLWCEPCYVRLGIVDGTAAFSDAMARLGGVRIVTWAISRNPLRPGALVTAGDVCHLHPDRAAVERCGALMGGAPDLVRLENHTARVYRVLWSLSDVAGGELRKPAPPPAPPPEKRPDAVRSWPGNVRISGPVAARAAWERLTGGDP